MSLLLWHIEDNTMTDTEEIKRLIFKASLKATRLKDSYNFMLIQGIEYALKENHITITDELYLIGYIAGDVI